jgi:hypothetical protein
MFVKTIVIVFILKYIMELHQQQKAIQSPRTLPTVYNTRLKLGKYHSIFDSIALQVLSVSCDRYCHRVLIWGMFWNTLKAVNTVHALTMGTSDTH